MVILYDVLYRREKEGPSLQRLPTSIWRPGRQYRKLEGAWKLASPFAHIMHRLRDTCRAFPPLPAESSDRRTGAHRSVTFVPLQGMFSSLSPWSCLFLLPEDVTPPGPLFHLPCPLQVSTLPITRCLLLSLDMEIAICPNYGIFLLAVTFLKLLAPAIFSCFEVCLISCRGNLG